MNFHAGYPARYEFLEKEHDDLGQILKDLSFQDDSISIKALVIKILSQLKVHFSNEEKAMHESQYPDTQRHALYHEQLTHSLKAILELYDKSEILENRETIARYVEDKIREETLADRNFAQFLKEQEVSAASKGVSEP